ncbi:maleylacetate reductase [Sphingopyxis indica]|uniref:maleylacetate reductase n=1 Tax=Sphingopyxis indica TaxID=436663 RepID=UPI002938D498|nr:maleylacetate reductase [Sphingopyxis indica]WOF43006.1 maleylacetate reductase [Sphingopyxis indica]
MGFIYNGLPAHVIFGRGSIAQTAQLIGELGGKRALLVTTPNQADDARTALAGVEAIVAHFDGATMHTPTNVTEQALELVKSEAIDSLIAFGGGSTIGLAKALALRTDLPQLAIPTTYAGSEMTPVLGQTENGRKTTLRDLAVLPEKVLYDVDLTLGLPADITGTSGVNAIAHAVEGMYARDGNPVMTVLAERAIGLLAEALPPIIENPLDIPARERALEGAWLCGTVLGSVGMALHHKLCHTLGGALNLPHATTHTIVLPHALAYNLPAIPDVGARLERILRGDPAQRLFDLGRAIKAPAGLRDLGMAEADIETVTTAALENAYWNPRPLEREGIRALIARAWAGERPA